MFFPVAQSPTPETWLVRALRRGDPQCCSAMPLEALRELDPGLPVYIQPWVEVMEGVLFPIAHGDGDAGRAWG